MMDGLNSLFPDKEVESIQCLYEDRDCRYLVKKEIGSKILDTDGIIEMPSLDQIVCIISVSPFATSEQECVDVAAAINWGVKKTDILPLLVKYYNGECSQLEMAYSCLVSVSFYRKAIERRHNRTGAPDIGFYRGRGIQFFYDVGKEEISVHFDKWVSFLPEIFV